MPIISLTVAGDDSITSLPAPDALTSLQSRHVGTRTRVAEALNRRRGLSISVIRGLHERLGISAEALIRLAEEPGPGDCA